MSSNPVRVGRRNKLNLLKDGGKLESFDEFPVLRPEVDPQLHVSNNSVDQPFALVCGKDTVLAQVTGRARVAFEDGPVRYFDLEAGDHVYVPAGSEHRVETLEPGIQLRYRAREPGVEGVVWRCKSCRTELDRHVWDSAQTVTQTGYQFACERHNNEESRRTCKSCEARHDPIDLSPFRWAAVALAQAEVEEDF